MKRKNGVGSLIRIIALLVFCAAGALGAYLLTMSRILSFVPFIIWISGFILGSFILVLSELLFLLASVNRNLYHISQSISSRDSSEGYSMTKPDEVKFTEYRNAKTMETKYDDPPQVNLKLTPLWDPKDNK